MNIIKIVFLSLLIGVIGIRCSEPDTKAIGCYPTIISFPDNKSVGLDTVVRQFIYNNANQVILDINDLGHRVNIETKVDFICDYHNYYAYDKNGNIISSHGCNDTKFYKYDVNNNLIQMENNDSSIITTYQYNSTNQLISETKTSNSHSIFTKTYEYPNLFTKNPERMSLPSCCNMMEIHEYEYDDKPNPMRILFPSIRSDNNLIKHTYSFPSDKYGLIKGTQIFTYEYNVNGYPISAVHNSFKQTITYECK